MWTHRASSAPHAGGQRTPEVLVSCPFVSPWLETELPSGWVVRARPSDWQRGRWTALAQRVSEVVRLAFRARHFDALIVSTASIELLLLCLLRPVLGQCCLTAYDPLQPNDARVRRLLLDGLARRIDLVMCIRRADLALWGRSRRQEFVAFLAPQPVSGDVAASTEPTLIYSAGDAHRDYALLVDALAGVDLGATICTRQSVDTGGNDRIEVRGAVSPEEGRELQGSSGITAVLITQTTLPAGPLVLLDAMAAGAAIVCTRSPGLIDYVNHGIEALILSDPPVSGELAHFLQRLHDDPVLRSELGTAARHRLATEWASSSTLARCEALISELIATTSDPNRYRGTS